LNLTSSPAQYLRVNNETDGLSADNNLTAKPNAGKESNTLSTMQKKNKSILKKKNSSTMFAKESEPILAG